MGKSDKETFTHGFHPWFASFHPQVPRTFIKQFTSQGDTVLDPFCGSGTTLVEAKLAGIESIGIDVNPLACLITKVKTTPINDEKLSSCANLLENISSNLNVLFGQTTLTKDKRALLEPKIPNFRNRDYWFKPHVLTELGTIKAHIDALKDNDLRDFCSVALSSIIVGVSNQQHETKYKRVDKKVGLYATYKKFETKLKQMIDKLKEFNKVASNRGCKVYCEDLRHCTSIENETADLIVTSPPYLNAWDYNLYQKFRFYWLGFDRLKFRSVEIGAHLKHAYIKDSVKIYIEDMRLCLHQMYQMLRRGGHCSIVVGEAVVQGERVDVGKILRDVATDLGFISEKIYTRKIFGPHFSQSRSIGNKIERIIVLRKP